MSVYIGSINLELCLFNGGEVLSGPVSCWLVRVSAHGGVLASTNSMFMHGGWDETLFILESSLHTNPRKAQRVLSAQRRAFGAVPGVEADV